LGEKVPASGKEKFPKKEERRFLGIRVNCITCEAVYRGKWRGRPFWVHKLQLSCQRKEGKKRRKLQHSNSGDVGGAYRLSDIGRKSTLKSSGIGEKKEFVAGGSIWGMSVDKHRVISEGPRRNVVNRGAKFSTVQRGILLEGPSPVFQVRS